MGFLSFIHGFVPDVWFQGMTLRSYTGVMLINSIRLRRRDRKLRRSLKRLKSKYTPDRIARIYNKYSNAKKLSARKEQRNKRKFENELNNLISSFIYDYAQFRAYYLDALKLISQSLISDKRENFREITSIEALFVELDKKRQDLKFPFREVETFKDQVVELLEDISHDIREDESSDIRVQKGGYPAGISRFSFRKWWSKRKIYRKEKKEIRKVGKNLELFEQLYNKILQELQSGPRQDFLFLLIEVFKRVDIADDRLENIKEDLMLVLKKLHDEVEGVKNALHSFLELLRNEPQIKNNSQLANMEYDIKKLEELLITIPQQDFKNTEALKKELGKLLQEGNLIIREMEQLAA